MYVPFNYRPPEISCDATVMTNGENEDQEQLLDAEDTPAVRDGEQSAITNPIM